MIFMIDQIVQFIAETFRGSSPEFLTALFSALPVIELRTAIPIGIKFFGLSASSAFLAAWVGNTLAGIGFLYILGPIERLFLKHSPKWSAVVKRQLDAARDKFSGTHAKYGVLGLIIFIAIPLPLTGAWTGAAAAHVMGLPKKMASLSIALGVLGAAVLVTLATVGIIRIF